MLSVNCNFEHSLCGWDQVSEEDDIDWIRGSRRTNSGGPSSDHTYGNSSKFPVYVLFISLRLIWILRKKICCNAK